MVSNLEMEAQTKKSTKAPMNIGPQINRSRDNAHLLLRFLPKSRFADISNLKIYL